jgi:hypothetical protein
MVNSTAAASSGEPSWKAPSGIRWKTIVLLSLMNSHSFAAPGMVLPSRSRRASGS